MKIESKDPASWWFYKKNANLHMIIFLLCLFYSLCPRMLHIIYIYIQYSMQCHLRSSSYSLSSVSALSLFLFFTLSLFPLEFFILYRRLERSIAYAKYITQHWICSIGLTNFILRQKHFVLLPICIQYNTTHGRCKTMRKFLLPMVKGTQEQLTYSTLDLEYQCGPATPAASQFLEGKTDRHPFSVDALAEQFLPATMTGRSRTVGPRNGESDFTVRCFASNRWISRMCHLIFQLHSRRYCGRWVNGHRWSCR